MRKSAVVAAILAVAALPVTAQTMVEDTDGNGTYSLEEMQVAYPDLSEDLFAEIDADGDGAVSVEELADAVANGIVAG